MEASLVNIVRTYLKREGGGRGRGGGGRGRGERGEERRKKKKGRKKRDGEDMGSKGKTDLRDVPAAM
jgi:hypothetical protein